MNGTVYLVDDDDAVRGALARLLEGKGLRVKAFASAEEFLVRARPGQGGCLILDVRLPGASGPELQETLARQDIRLPVIFLTGHGDVSTSVRALKAGAFDFLEKPPDPAVLVERVRAALRLAAEQRRRHRANQAAQARLAQLTPREREIMPLVAQGYSSKEIGRRLGISHRTVELHRLHLMRKLGVRSVLELAALVQGYNRAAPPSAAGDA